YAITQTPQVCLDCQVLEDIDGISVNWDVRAGVFQPGVIEAMAGAFARLLADLARNERSWRSADPVHLPDAQLQTRNLANATSAPTSGQLLHESFLIHAASAPDTDAEAA